MSSTTIELSEEAAFRSGLKEAGFVSSDFMIKYDNPAPKTRAVSKDAVAVAPASVRVRRISTDVVCTYTREEGAKWAASALEQLRAGVFGEK